MIEIYREVKGYEGIYEVSNLGNVKGLNRKSPDGKRIKERVLKLGLGGAYLTVNLRKEGVSKTFSVHTLVAVAFLSHMPNRYEGLIVDHIDNDPLNNRVDNLQLTTQRRNISKDKKGGTSEYAGVCWNKQANKWLASVYIDRKQEHLGYFTNELDASQAYIKRLQTL